MSVEYTYARTLVNGVWNVDNKMRVDANGDQIYLAAEVRNALPGRPFTEHSHDVVLKFTFETDLSAEDKATLDSVVSDHQNNV